MKILGVDVSYALSPQAKGKVERPYRWLQDRIVRTCAIEKLTAIEEVRAVLREELERYNNHQVHSTTGEIPGVGEHTAPVFLSAVGDQDASEVSPLSPTGRE